LRLAGSLAAINEKRNMKKFTLDKHLLPFNFFDEIDFSYKKLAINCIRQKFNHLSESEIENVFIENDDNFQNILFELYNLSELDYLEYYWVGDYEIDEASGTWAYSEFEVDDVKKARKKVEKETKILFKELVDEIEI